MCFVRCYMTLYAYMGSLLYGLSFLKPALKYLASVCKHNRVTNVVSFNGSDFCYITRLNCCC